MPRNFKNLNRKQLSLMPESMEDWLPEDHLARFIAELLEEEIDLRRFHLAYRADGRGGEAFPPAVIAGLLLYAYCNGERSSRKIEALCTDSVAYRYLAVNQVIDHSTISRFRVRHEKDLKPLFLEILRRCVELNLVKVGVLALDGTKIKGNASMAANRTEEGLEREITKMLAEADSADRDEDGKYGKGGKEEFLPAELKNKEARRIRLKELREQRNQLAQAKDAVRAVQEDKIAARAAEEERRGTKMRGRKPTSPEELEIKEPKVNLTDPDSRIMKTQKGYVQGYNAQVVATAEQIIVSAELTQECNDLKQLVPMVQTTMTNLAIVGVEEPIGTVLGDAGYPTEDNLAATEKLGVTVLAATQKEWKQRKAQRETPTPCGRMPEQATRMERMTRQLLTERGKSLYKLRCQIIEPVFGQIKFDLGHDRFSRRGASACQSEWYLICGAHNLLKMWRQTRNEWN